MNVNKTAGAGILTALIASLCCITPVFAFIAGASGIAATFAWLEPLRPYLIGLTIVVLGLALYQKLKPVNQEEVACDCADGSDGKGPFLQSKKFLGIVTMLAALLLTFPSYSHIFYSNGGKENTEVEASGIQQLNMEVKGMTCSGCEEHVKHALNRLDGILEADVSYEESRATVKFDTSQTSSDEIIEAINDTGYKVVNQDK